MVRVFRRAVASGSGFRLVVSTPAVQRVLSITGVDRMVDVFPSVAASLAGPYGQPDQAQPGGATATADTATADTDGAA